MNKLTCQCYNFSRNESEMRRAINKILEAALGTGPVELMSWKWPITKQSPGGSMQ